MAAPIRPPTVPTLAERASGILLHPTCLPGKYGCGDLGPEATRFALRLAGNAQRWWQMLPVGPVGFGNSPYSALSAFAGNPLLVSLEGLVRDGLLEPEALAGSPRFPVDRVDFARVAPWRESLLRRAFQSIGRAQKAALARFREAEAGWLEDYVLYRALKFAHVERAWIDWDRDLRLRRRSAVERAREELSGEIAFRAFEQFLFARDWQAFRATCRELGIGLIGDAPIFVAHDSADVWANRESFQLDEEGRPTVVAGVPPDYFSRTGQRWGNPLYQWDKMARGGFRWWTARVAKALERFDVVRLDHFIGFHRAWAIPADEPTAMRGTWQPGPGAALFETLARKLGQVPFIAEDLGLVTPEVKALRDRFSLPGLKILQFAFGTDPSAPDFVPYVYPRAAVVYTGTHDNDTVVGWFRDPLGTGVDSPAAQEERERALDYLGGAPDEIHWSMIRAASGSVANLCLVPLQDVLGLGSEARMNRPGTLEGNWEWRLSPRAKVGAALERLAKFSRTFGRA